ncbi:ABC transporter permease [Thermoanaerobacter mathranii]|uniref:ABC transporter permease n=1 Tax=Thermoanaerobacter mathranii TaxID=583357 RepID=UPI003AAA5239
MMENSHKIKKKSYDLKKLFAIREMSIVLIIFILIILMSVFIPDFMTASNISTTLVGLSMDGIIAVGMTMVLVLGGIDLSVGSVMALSNVIAGILMSSGFNAWLSVLIAIFVSIIAGGLVGALITKINLNPFITTLSMMSIARGIAYVFTKGSPVSLGTISKSFDSLGQGQIFGIPNPVIILFVLVIVFDYLMRNSATFRQIYYVGSNEKAAYLSGINVNKVKLFVYILSALLSGIAGIITLSRFGVATPTVGTGAELRAIAGAVIGGASLSGGVGTIWGALLGILLVGLVNNALILLNVSVYWQSLVTGIVLLSAVVIDVYAHAKKQ